MNLISKKKKKKKKKKKRDIGMTPIFIKDVIGANRADLALLIWLV
jgi:hypothetical protein